MVAELPPATQPSQQRRGFALLAAIVLVAIFTVLATVITVNLSGDNDAKRIEKVADVLRRFEIETDSSAPSFRIDVNKFPRRLSDLSIDIVSTDLGSCTTGTYGTNATAWNGPYHIFPVTTRGSYLIGPGFVANDLMVRSPANGSTAGTLAIVIPNVSLSDARMLGIAVDGVNTGVGPRVAFSSTDPTTVSYRNPVITGLC